jgi:hypothetical protein
VQRALVDRLRNRTNIVMSVAAPLVLGGAMAAMLRGPDVPYTYAGNTALGRFFFLSTIVFVFFGLMASVNEIIKELALIRRERVSGFRAGQYVAAKTLAFLPFSILQVAIYALLAAVVLQFPYQVPPDVAIRSPLPYPYYFALVLFLVAQASFALGLLISSFLRTQAAAFNWIPLVIIPQILLGGVFVEYQDLPKLVNRVVPEYAEVTFSRWAYEALLAGEKDLNPADLQNVDTISGLRLAYAAAGRPFDLAALIERPRARWQATPGLTLPPPFISAAVMHDALLERLRLYDRTADAELLEGAYRRLDRRTYALRPDLPPDVEERLPRILMSPETGWWASAFSTRGVNATLEAERQQANLPDPEHVPRWRALLTDRSDYPARVRLLGDAPVRVAVWNAGVLVVMTLGCHLVSVLRLRVQH